MQQDFLQGLGWDTFWAIFGVIFAEIDRNFDIAKMAQNDRPKAVASAKIDHLKPDQKVCEILWKFPEIRVFAKPKIYDVVINFWSEKHVFRKRHQNRQVFGPHFGVLQQL